MEWYRYRYGYDMGIGMGIQQFFKNLGYDYIEDTCINYLLNIFFYILLSKYHFKSNNG